MPQPPREDVARFDDLLGDGWAVVVAESALLAGSALPRGSALPAGVAAVVEPRATYGSSAVLVRPDRYIAAAGDDVATVLAALPDWV